VRDDDTSPRGADEQPVRAGPVPASGPLHPSPALTALVDHERTAAERFTVAEREARAILEEARARAEARRAAVEEEVAAALHVLETEAAERERCELDRLRAALLAELSRFENLDDSAVERLAERVLSVAVGREETS